MNPKSNPFSQLFGQGNPNTSNQAYYHNNQSPYHNPIPQNYPPQNTGYQGNNNSIDQHSYGSSNKWNNFNSFMHNQQQQVQNKKNTVNQQKNNQIQSFNTSINIENLTPKQLLCECIDLATTMLKQIVDAYVKNNEIASPYEGKKVIDFSLLANFILEPTRLQKILTQFLSNDDQSVKALVKSWIFQLKYIRNLWAHSEKINYRLAFRGYDTLGLLFDSFGGNQSSDLYSKIEMYRKSLLIVQAKSGAF